MLADAVQLLFWPAAACPGGHTGRVPRAAAIVLGGRPGAAAQLQGSSRAAGVHAGGCAQRVARLGDDAPNRQATT